MSTESKTNDSADTVSLPGSVEMIARIMQRRQPNKDWRAVIVQAVVKEQQKTADALRETSTEGK